MLAAFARTNLIVLDDWGTATLTDQQRRDLFEILEDRYDRHSTLIAAQLPVKHWHEIIGDPTLADAILDRVIHNAHQITLTRLPQAGRRINAQNEKTPDQKQTRKYSTKNRVAPLRRAVGFAWNR